MSKIRLVMGPGQYIVFAVIAFLVVASIIAFLLPYILILVGVAAVVVATVLIVKHIRKKKGEVK